MRDEFATFEDFWPFYVGEHGSATTRWLHFAGLGTALGCAATAVLTRRPRWLLAALLAGYGPAWVSHFFVEHNRPATFRHPLWSFRADVRMFGLMLAGRMDAEIARLRSVARERDVAVSPPGDLRDARSMN